MLQETVEPLLKSRLRITLVMLRGVHLDVAWSLPAGGAPACPSEITAVGQVRPFGSVSDGKVPRQDLQHGTSMGHRP